MVAMPAPSGMFAAPCDGFNPMDVLVEKGRIKREMKLGIMFAMKIVRRKIRSFLSEFRFTAC
jgi:hypothetical protein